MKVSVVIEKDEHGYYAFSPELEGCQSQGAPDFRGSRR